MPQVLESIASDLNDRVFYREFSFAKSEFVGLGPGDKKEFADHVVWIDNLLIIYQAKERTKQKNLTPESERKWFDKKVIGTATKQVRDTLEFLDQGPVKVRNTQGHEFDLDRDNVDHVLKLVLYDPSAELPPDRLAVKHHQSATAGFIHIVAIKDYFDVCQVLITPAEVAQYFDFREQLITAWIDQSLPKERALLGQFVVGDASAAPDDKYAEALDSINAELDFDMRFVIGGIAERIESATDTASPTDYYRIIAEFAKLDRLELAEVKERFTLCLKAALRNESEGPWRIVSTNTGSGFLFVALRAITHAGRVDMLNTMTLVAKYEQHLERQVGVSIAHEGRDFLIDWCYVESPWAPDDELDEMLRNENPFAPMRNVARRRY